MYEPGPKISKGRMVKIGWKYTTPSPMGPRAQHDNTSQSIPVQIYRKFFIIIIGGASSWVLGHDLHGAIHYVIKRRRISQLSLKIEVTIMLKFQGRQIKIRLIGRASPSAQHAKEWKHCLLLHLM